MREKICTKSDYKEWIRNELCFLKYPFLAFIPLNLFEAQIIGRFIVLLRKTEFYTNTNKKVRKIIYLFRLKKIQNRYGLHIPINVCGKGLSIAHLGSIIINGNAQIGTNLRVHVGVVIGANELGTPTLGNNIYIGPGAKIFGKIVIADDCKIGANAVVNKSFEENGLTLVGVPAVSK